MWENKIKICGEFFNSCWHYINPRCRVYSSFVPAEDVILLCLGKTLPATTAFSGDAN